MHSVSRSKHPTLFDLPTTVVVSIDRQCLAFEAEWRQGNQPSIASVLEAFNDANVHGILFGELLKLELEYLSQQGPIPTCEHYLRSFPAFREEIECVFSQPLLGCDASTDEAPVVARADGDAWRSTGVSRNHDGKRYAKVRFLAHGGLGEVHVAIDRELDREVALKEIRNDLRESEIAFVRFYQEAKITGRLEHPGIVPVYGLGRNADGTPFYAMRLIRGETLEAAIKSAANRDSSLAQRRFLTRFVALCQTIAYAHSRGIVHRDLKPSNVMLGEHGETLIVDWGAAAFQPGESAGESSNSAREGHEESFSTCAGEVIGTPAYMSPEQALGDIREIGPATDVYALGAILFVILTGRPPIEGSSRDAILQAARVPRRLSPRALNHRVPRALDAVCRKAMSPQPSDRYESASSLAEEMELWLAGSPVSAWPEPLLTRALRWLHRNQMLAASVGIAALMAVMCFVVVAVATSRIRHRNQVDGLVQRIEAADLQSLPGLLASLDPIRAEAYSQLRTRLGTSRDTTNSSRNLALALLPSDSDQLPTLIESLFTCELQDFLVLRDLMRPHASRVAPTLWQRWQTGGHRRAAVLRIASALAAYDADNTAWSDHAEEVVELVVHENPLPLELWIVALRPVSECLRSPLLRVFQQEPTSTTGRAAATMLAAFAGADTSLLVDLLRSADASQLAPIIDQLAAASQRSQPLLLQLLENPPQPSLKVFGTDNPLKKVVAQSALRARAAVALFALGEPDRVWPLLEASIDPTLQSQLIHLFASSALDPALLIDRWHQSGRGDERRAIALILGNYHPTTLNPNQRALFVASVAQAFCSDSDPGVHSACEWLLRKWGEGERLRAAGAEFIFQPGPSTTRCWFVNRQGQTLAVVPGPVEFYMGSPPSEWGRMAEEQLHRRRIDRSFALSTHEITVADYSALASQKHPTVDTHFAASPDCPAVFMRWFQAVRYCRRLSELEGVSEDQQCYPPEKEIGPGMRLPDNFLRRTGYRLPTAAEWEYACRAGTISRTSFGNDIAMADHFAWGAGNMAVASQPIATLKPNGLGLFDMLGNVSEWTMEVYHDYRTRPDWGLFMRDDFLFADTSIRTRHIARGGSFVTLPDGLRSALGGSEPSTFEVPAFGFRICRTLSPDEVGFHISPNAPGSLDKANYSIHGAKGSSEISHVAGDVSVVLHSNETPVQIEVTPQRLGYVPYSFVVTDLGTGEKLAVRNALLTLNWRLKFYQYTSADRPRDPTPFRSALSAKRPRATSEASTVDFQWGLASPQPHVPADQFALRAETTFSAPAGLYAFSCRTGDGLYVEIDGHPLGGFSRLRQFPGDISYERLEAGEHRVEFIYCDESGPAELLVEIRPLVERSP